MELKKIDKYRCGLPVTGQMLVPGIIYTSESMLQNIKQDGILKQVENVASLPGIVKASMTMPIVIMDFPLEGLLHLTGTPV